MQLEPLVEEALAGDVGVDADDVGRAGGVHERVELVLARTAAAQPFAQRMRASDAAGEQVEREPAALVVEGRLVGECRRASREAEVVGLHELGVGDDLADRPHRQHRGLHLVQQGTHEAAVVGGVRIPQAVQRRETRRRQRLVDRRPGALFGVAFGDAARVVGKQRGKVVGQQVRVRRSAAVVQQPHDGLQAAFAHAMQRAIGPLEIEFARAACRGVFPQHRQAHAGGAQRREAVDVLEPMAKAGERRLVAPTVSHAVDRALRADPQLRRAASLPAAHFAGTSSDAAGASMPASRRCAWRAASFLKSVSDCATTWSML